MATPGNEDEEIQEDETKDEFTVVGGAVESKPVVETEEKDLKEKGN